MLRDGTWENYVKQMAKNRQQNSRPVVGKFSDIYLHPVNNFADTLYVANITLGTPDQLFRVVLVTGSSVFWVPDATCGRPKKPGCEQSECDQGLKMFLAT
ncbi:hypothetical protein OESDEN_15973 [Oesophagostomum dentatum]|uniref:Peptidase A1 domain-containing protein n=1 Tax=Oesophagostomum dentatum TaxID=61180 RepID=A0A0B1SKA1_OESDE|nr:hypothetical protein OESDEN_15973 [Oesophagostomum dentatum]